MQCPYLFGRHCLWILGNAATLLWSRSFWGELVRDAKDRQCFFDANDNNNLARSILHVKCELDQFNDLFKADSTFTTSTWKVN